MKSKQLDFSNQTVFVGIDVHKKSWSITIICFGLKIRTLRIDPNPDILINYLHKNYPGAKYMSVYEAGFCGYWIDRRLRAEGVTNIIVNPADVPTTNKERTSKTDLIDSRKLCRELSTGSLEGIFIPSDEAESLRTLSRLRKQLTKDQARLKNRIKSLLDFTGIKLPEKDELQHWSRKFIDYLSEMEIEQKATKCTLERLLNSLIQMRKEIAGIIKDLRKMVEERPEIAKTIGHLQSIPGIGFVTAITLYTEIINIRRFKKFDKLCNFVGLAPTVLSSGEKEKTLGISNRQNKYLRSLLIESAWIAVRKDPALTLAFGKLTARMSKQEAIIRIAKKLLNRAKYVWQKNQDYAFAVV